MACGQVLQPHGMDDRYGPPQQQAYQQHRQQFFPQARPTSARPPLHKRARQQGPPPTQQYNSAPPTRLGKRRRGGKRNKQRQTRPRLPTEGAETPMTLPLTAPHAPYNSNSYLMRRDDEMSLEDGERLPQGTGCYPTLDGDAAELGAQLDFFGTGMDSGLLADYRSDSESDSEEEEDDDWSTASAGVAQDPEAAEERALRKLPEAVRLRLVAEKRRLEALEGENLELRERLSLAELEIADLKAKQRAGEAAVAPAAQPSETAAAEAAAPAGDV